MKHQLEHFPKSQSAQRMLSRVSPIYDNSYVAKWLFEVMGTELDEVREQYDDLRLQAFPETATWAMDYWEERYGIDTDARLDLETRRSHVIAKRDTRVPMNPTRLEKILADMTAREFQVTENVAPYVFLVEMMDGRNEVDYKKILKVLRNIKPSHQNFRLNAVMDGIEWQNENLLHFWDLGLDYRHSFYNFGRYVSFDGERYFDGSLFFGQEVAKKLHFYDFCMTMAIRNKVDLGQMLAFAAAFETENEHHFRDLQLLSRFQYGMNVALDDLQVGFVGPKHVLALSHDDLLLQGYAAQNKNGLTWPNWSVFDPGWQTDNGLDFTELGLGLKGAQHVLRLHQQDLTLKGMGVKNESQLTGAPLWIFDPGWATASQLHFPHLQADLAGMTHVQDLLLNQLQLSGAATRNESRLYWPAISMHGSCRQMGKLAQPDLVVNLPGRRLDPLLTMAVIRMGEVLFHNHNAFAPQIFLMGDRVTYRSQTKMPDVQATLATRYQSEALTGSLTKDSRHYMDGSRYFNGVIPFNSELIEEEL